MARLIWYSVISSTFFNNLHSNPVKNSNEESAQIILPAKQIADGKKRKRDVYICMVSYHHKVCADGKYVAVMSAEVEGKEIPALEKDAKACEAGVMRELEDAIKLVGNADQRFCWVTDSYAPVGDGKQDNCFISSTYDASTHFESSSREVLKLYELITGQQIDLSIQAGPDELKDPDQIDDGEEGEQKDGGAGDDGAVEEIGGAAGAEGGAAPAAAAGEKQAKPAPADG